MNKVLLIIILVLLFPITVFAKTPTKDDVLSLMQGISNEEVVDGVTIESARIEGYNIVFTIKGKEEYVSYSSYDDRMTFGNGYLEVDDNGKITITNNDSAVLLYSILVNKSGMPKDKANYYSSENIKSILSKKFVTQLKEPTNTFGIYLNPIGNNKYVIIYDYYYSGDYPIIYDDGAGLFNPATGGYTILVLIVLIAILALGIYAYINRGKKQEVI